MCIACSRRGVLLGSVALALSPTIARADQIILCGNKGRAPSAFTTYSTSGNARIDRAMVAEIKNILKYLPVDPGFKFIRDDRPNAYASPESRVQGTKGTVYIGLKLISNEFTNDELGGVAVAGIVAHECAHIYQFDNGYIQSLGGNTAKLVELHADFLAGFYLGSTQRHSKKLVRIFGESLFEKGDYDFNDPQHHGTPEQRVDCMEEGYETGVKRLAARDAARSGAAYVRQFR